MSSIDPISNLLSLINNGQRANKSIVVSPYSKLQHSICNILVGEGYLQNIEIQQIAEKKYIKIELKYFQGRPVIDVLKRVSKPGRRVYAGLDDLPNILNGLGVSIISTPKGVMSDKSARKLRIGGEIICSVS